MDSSEGFWGRGDQGQWGKGFGKPLLEDPAEKRPVYVGIEAWQSALAKSSDRNPVSALYSSRNEAGVQKLFVNFKSEWLCNVGPVELWSGVLTVNNYFLTRGVGPGHKGCEQDAYTKAYYLLLDTHVNEILNQWDVGVQRLKEEMYWMFDMDPYRFMDKYGPDSALAAANNPPAPQYPQGYGQGGGGGAAYPNSSYPQQGQGYGAGGGQGDSGYWQGGGKRPPGPEEGPEAKKRFREQEKNALVPKTKIEVLLDKQDPLDAKLLKLKELLKVEGITKLHIVPKVDQIAHKTAINMKNVYKYDVLPLPGCENQTPVFCEVYCDDVFIARGDSAHEPNHAMQSAYRTMVDLLCTRPIREILSSTVRWKHYMEKQPEVCHVNVKFIGNDNDVLLTSNLTNMKQMMGSGPDVSVTIDRMIITEHEADSNRQSTGLNFFKVLELSCTRNLVLLECEMVRNRNGNFTCTMSLNGTQMCSKSHLTKNGAKRFASETIMKSIKDKNDYIYVHKEYVGVTINRRMLLEGGTRHVNEGLPPSMYVAVDPGHPNKSWYSKALSETDANNTNPADAWKAQQAALENDRIENLPDNIAMRPLMPYMAAALYKILDEHFEKFSLEDLIVDKREMPRSMFEMVMHCAAQMSMGVVHRLRGKGKENLSLLRSQKKAGDIFKMLQINDGKSGRYELKKLVHPTPPEDLETFKTESLARLKELQVDREDPTKIKQTATSFYQAVEEHNSKQQQTADQ